MSGVDWIEHLAARLGVGLGNLGAALSDPEQLQALVRALGSSLDPSVEVAAVSQLLGTLPADLTSLSSTVTALKGSSVTADVAAAESLVSSLQHVVSDVERLASQPVPSTAPAPFNDPGFWRTFGSNALAMFAADALRLGAGKLFTIVQLLGGVDHASVDSLGNPTIAARMNWNNLVRLFSDPGSLIRQTYGWGAGFDHLTLIHALNDVAVALGFPTNPATPADEVTAAYWAPIADPMTAIAAALRVPLLSGFVPFTLVTADDAVAGVQLIAGALPIPDETKTGTPCGILLYLEAAGSIPASFPIGDTFTVSIDGEIDGLVGVALRPTGATLQAGASAALSLKATASPPGPWVLGDPSGTRMTVNALNAAINLKAATTGGTHDEFIASVSGAFTAYIDLGGADSLVADLLGSGTVQASFSAGAQWSNLTGLRLVGGVTAVASGSAPAVPNPSLLSISLPVNFQIADVLAINSVTIDGASVTGGSRVRVLCTGDLTLGPLGVTFDRIGIALTLRSGQSGNLGPIDLQLGFSPPQGLGLAVEAPLVTGGGYLGTDPSSGTYIGALELSVGTISIQGIGILATKVPGGGWSLVALADVEGLTVQLGFGIELTGIGILVGINRTMNVTALQGLARSGGLNTVMFPADLAANAPRVAADLENLFPTAKGQYVFGPTVQLVWGSGSLITGEVAVYIELPSPVRIAVLGSLQIALPEPEAPVVQLNLDLLGIIDLTAKTLSLDMALSHSQLAGMPLTGQAALRAGWGSQPEFVLAVGGFNPHFIPPAGFPQLNRVGLTLGSGKMQLRLTSYFAVTSNTLQFGAAIDLRASAGPAALTATVSFDALIQYKPFALEVDLSIVAAITLGGSPILSINISAHFTGPGPWHISGKAQFSVLFFSFTIPISGTFGASTSPALPATVDVIAPLAAAVADPHSWMLSAPPGVPVVVIAGGAPSSLVHPLGAMTVSQRVVPLEQPINRFGADVLPEPMSLRLSGGGATTASAPVTAYFAPAQFVTMTDAQRLSAPSFEPLTAGFTIGSPGFVVPVAGGTSAAEPSGAPVSIASTAAWDALVVDVPSGAAAATAAPQITSTKQVAVPAAVLAGQVPDAAASISGSTTVGAGRYSNGPQLLIGPQTPSYSIASLAMSAPTAMNLQSNVSGLTQLRPNEQILFRSELSGQHPL